MFQYVGNTFMCFAVHNLSIASTANINKLMMDYKIIDEEYKCKIYKQDVVMLYDSVYPIHAKYIVGWRLPQKLIQKFLNNKQNYFIINGDFDSILHVIIARQYYSMLEYALISPNSFYVYKYIIQRGDKDLIKKYITISNIRCTMYIFCRKSLDIINMFENVYTTNDIMNLIICRISYKVYCEDLIDYYIDRVDFNNEEFVNGILGNKVLCDKYINLLTKNNLNIVSYNI